ncbi:hypothetical protein TTHERM_01105000 (macronuclear) [Tetrahymena thermophila SB210]|uniref:Uncharacterized protein n=1 Tax=Tetrahymena thermophila (strain SB210) TaxID=312017 RepID=Q24D59_TETTS|nr:hypothetical protein TTHERM_01105000 [Tetrahymena thermophila SB210]EAS05730.2 hypothetical protein TTHERM_01105000 [Tetrahymena thermophila SB210]|eukprot:XP_001025975.2 hypothetical protein TTHERM_01105000 [Tetrahymena thermophila SB210]
MQVKFVNRLINFQRRPLNQTRNNLKRISLTSLKSFKQIISYIDSYIGFNASATNYLRQLIFQINQFKMFDLSDLKKTVNIIKRAHQLLNYIKNKTLEILFENNNKICDLGAGLKLFDLHDK